MSQTGTLDYADMKATLRNIAIFAFPMILSHQEQIGSYITWNLWLNASYVALFFAVVVDLARRAKNWELTIETAITDISQDIGKYFPWTIEESTAEDLSGGSTVGKFKPVPEDFQKSLGNQKQVAWWCCQTHAFVQSMCMMDGKEFDYDVLRSAWNQWVKDGKFAEGTGGYMSDGARYATLFYNLKYGTTWKATSFIFTPENAVDKMATKNSPIIFALRGSIEYFRDEQDNGSIDTTTQSWKYGHCVALVKTNNEDEDLGVQAKYVENYHGVKKFDIIYINLTKASTEWLLQKTGFYLTK